MYIFVILMVLLGLQEPALEPAQEPALAHIGDSGQSAYVGCHVVEENPKDGNAAYGPFGIITPVVFFKQVSDDGNVGPITTAKPC